MCAKVNYHYVYAPSPIASKVHVEVGYLKYLNYIKRINCVTHKLYKKLNLNKFNFPPLVVLLSEMGDHNEEKRNSKSLDKIIMKDFLASELSEEPNMDACVKALARELAERETSASICSSYVRNIMATFPEESYMEKLVGEWSNPSKMFRILVGASRSDRREVLRKFQQLLGPKNSKFDLKTFLEDHSFPIPSELISAQWIKAADEGDGNVIGCEYNTKEVIELFKSPFLQHWWFFWKWRADPVSRSGKQMRQQTHPLS